MLKFERLCLGRSRSRALTSRARPWLLLCASVFGSLQCVFTCQMPLLYPDGVRPLSQQSIRLDPKSLYLVILRSKDSVTSASVVSTVM